MNDVPEFPPSDLICTPAEWSRAFRDGFKAYYEDVPYEKPPDGKFADPWQRGWGAAYHVDNDHWLNSDDSEAKV
jgi:hypothetical protein